MATAIMQQFLLIQIALLTLMHTTMVTHIVRTIQVTIMNLTLAQNILLIIV